MEMNVTMEDYQQAVDVIMSLRKNAIWNPEKFIELSDKIEKALKDFPSVCNAHQYYVDHKERMFTHTDRYFFTGESNVELMVLSGEDTLRIFAFKNSKVVIDFDNESSQIKVLQVHLYDEAEVYVETANDIMVCMRYFSPNAKGTVKTDDTCRVVMSYYDKNGIIESKKVEPKNSYYVEEFQRKE